MFDVEHFKIKMLSYRHDGEKEVKKYEFCKEV